MQVLSYWAIMNTVIEFRNVYKSFKRGQNVDSLRDLIPQLLGRFRPSLNKQKKRETFWALKDVNFEIKRGETVGLIGHNGSGKTTTLKLLSGILRQTKGEIYKKGRIGALIEVGAGFHGDLTGRENIYLNGSIMGMKKWEIAKKFDEIVTFAEVEDFIDTPVKRYSSGMYVRLGFSVAAHLEPEILLIDEVLAVGDGSFQKKCVNKIYELCKSGTIILFVSHNMGLVRNVCDRAILLSNGTIVTDGTSGEVSHIYTRHILDPGNKKPKVISKSQGKELKLVSAIPNKEKYDISDHRISLKFIYQSSSENVLPISIHCAIRCSDGTFVHHSTSKADGVIFEAKAGINEAYLLLEKSVFLSGEYTVDAAIAHEDDVSVVCFFPSVSSFEVANQFNDGAGILCVPRTWRKAPL